MRPVVIDRIMGLVRSSFRPSVCLKSPLLLLSSIISMMMRLLLDVSVCFCPTPEPLLVVQSTSLLLYLHLHCPSISSVVFLGFFSHWYSCSVMLLLAAVRFPFLIHARTSLVLALLFCQPVSFLDIEYHAQSHFSSYHVLLLSTIFLTMSLLLRGFVFHLLSSSTNILSSKCYGEGCAAVDGRPHNMSAPGRHIFLAIYRPWFWAWRLQWIDRLILHVISYTRSLTRQCRETAHLPKKILDIFCQTKLIVRTKWSIKVRKITTGASAAKTKNKKIELDWTHSFWGTWMWCDSILHITIPIMRR